MTSTLARPVDVVAYVRRLEAVLIGVCAALGVTAGRVEGRALVLILCAAGAGALLQGLTFWRMSSGQRS